MLEDFTFFFAKNNDHYFEKFQIGIGTNTRFLIALLIINPEAIHVFSKTKKLTFWNFILKQVGNWFDDMMI